jgi:hypothetical protein
MPKLTQPILTAAQAVASAPQATEVNSPTPQAMAFGIENHRVMNRRKALNIDQSRTPNWTAGLALSGGGLRSATFSLGILEAFARNECIPYLDYLSTVSGGSYIGAFFCSHYVPHELRGDVEQMLQADAIAVTDDPFQSPSCQNAFEHLRQSGRYLIPGSTGEAIKLLAIMSRNWLAVQFVIGLTFLAFFLTLKPIQNDLASWRALKKWEATWAKAHDLAPSLWVTNWLEGYQVGHWFIASPLFLFAIVALILVIASYWAYFLPCGTRVPARRMKRLFGASFLMCLFVWLIGLILALRPTWIGAGFPLAHGFGILLVIIASVSLAMYATAEWRDWRMQDGNSFANSPRVQEDRVRAKLTNTASWLLAGFVGFSFMGLIDSIAQTIYVRWTEFGYSLSIGGLVVVATPALHQLLIKLPAAFGAENKIVDIARRFGRLVALAIGGIVLFMIALFWAVVAHWIAWRGGPIASLERWRHPDSDHLISAQAGLWATLAVFACIAGAISLSFAFLNLSTYSNFYGTRLRRAYLGATNEDRYRTATPAPFDQDQVNDDIALDSYYHSAVMAPLHLINITINDTASAASNTIQRDRRGKPLTLSPAGYLYPSNSTLDPVLMLPFRDTAGATAVGPEKLPLSAWIAISGAAASTGVGQYGSFGLSLLAGLTNLRLGHWWSPGSKYQTRERFWNNLVQCRLADELQGRFPGSDGKRWYLTDGGHFENTGAYELVRRRVATIVLCDNGADPNYEFSDFVTLTRRIKIDFDAELTFLSEADLDGLIGTDTPLRDAFGSFDALASQPSARRSGPYASIATIKYKRDARDGEYNIGESKLILIKPRVCGCEPPDLSAYKKLNPAFPQQSTLDQDFDEAQWESYYRLGLLIGEHLTKVNSNGSWDFKAWLVR